MVTKTMDEWKHPRAATDQHHRAKAWTLWKHVPRIEADMLLPQLYPIIKALTKSHISGVLTSTVPCIPNAAASITVHSPFVQFAHKHKPYRQFSPNDPSTFSRLAPSRWERLAPIKSWPAGKNPGRYKFLNSSTGNRDEPTMKFIEWW